MRLYLSSFRMGNRTDQLLELAGGAGRVAVIANAMDAEPVDIRRAGVRRETDALSGLGFVAEELDLRDYFSDPGRVASDLQQYDVAWLRGGNCFLLRYALARSGADVALSQLLHEDAIVYGGYSAGPCVLAPSLKGLELVDDSGEVPKTFGDPPIWNGLNILDYAFVPHVDSPGHPESEVMNQVVEYYQLAGIPYKTLRDGEVLVVDGSETRLFA